MLDDDSSSDDQVVRRARGAVALALLGLLAAAGAAAPAGGAERVSLRVERHREGAPVLLGLPFPKGALASPDHVRLLDHDGRERSAQVSEVSSWEPADPSLKWIWVFFFAGASDRYVLEYGDDVRPRRPADGIEAVNSQRAQGLAEVTTGALRLTVRQGEGGFLAEASLDLEGDGFAPEDVIATGLGARGSWLDLLDSLGPDASTAVVRQTFIERGSGPLQLVLRVEGEYRYARDDNVPAPFVTRFHFYAGRPVVKVLHTLVYTGVPDRHRPEPGDYPHVATQAEKLTKGDPQDPGWTQPEDRIAAAGLGLTLRLGTDKRCRTALRPGRWWEKAAPRWVSADCATEPVSVRQSGPPPGTSGAPPTSSPTERIGGFAARVDQGARALAETETAVGLFDVSDGRRGVAVAMRHFVEAYPKALAFDPATGALRAQLWPDAESPLSLARASSRPGAEGSVENWARGLARTSELALYFHGADAGEEAIERALLPLIEPPVAHAEPAWYGRSGAFGRFAARGDRFPGLERPLDQRFEWLLFNQAWEPWYGWLDFGDVKVRYDGGDWDVWGHNEPAQDFEIWVQFMRTGDPRLFDAAQALSRHTMDVDNTHWPEPPRYRGDSNPAIDYWTTAALPTPEAARWRGVGRRHSAQHWEHALSAHVWVAGWLADYYLAGDHRALDVARQTADLHLRRLWGEHGLTGRRLYLSIWNLAETYDATKDPRYAEELRLRVDRLLRQQFEEGGSLVLERYGYAQPYATHGLGRYLDLTADERVARALVRHARRVRDVPPLNHQMESLLATLHPLALGWQLTGEESFRDAICQRTALMETEALARPVDASWTQAELAEALVAADHLPADPGRFRPDLSPRLRARSSNWDPRHGLRFFGWTHGLGLAWALDALER